MGSCASRSGSRDAVVQGRWRHGARRVAVEIRRSHALALVLLVGLLASPAAAQGHELAAPVRSAGEYRVTTRWDSYVFSAGRSELGLDSRSTSWANVLSAQLDVGALTVRLSVPLAYIDGERHSTFASMPFAVHYDQAELGNISVEAFGAVDLGTPEHRLLLGGGLAAPTATDQAAGDPLDLTGRIIRASAWLSSFRNPAAWQEHSFALWLSAEYRLSVPWLVVTAAAALPVFIPTDSRVGGPRLRGSVEMMVTVDVSAAVRILDIIDVGAAFLAWAMPSGAVGAAPPAILLRPGLGVPDLGQTAVTLFVRTDDALPFPIGGGFEMLFNLDETWGPTGSQDGYWGARVFLTARIDG